MMSIKETVILLNPPGTVNYLRDCYCSQIPKTSYYWHPMDLLVQSGFLQRYFNVRLIDAILDRKSTDVVIREVKKIGPKAVLVLVGNCSLQEDIAFLRRLKSQVATTVIVSGDLPYFKPEEVLKEVLEVDAILLDFMSPDLAEYLQDGLNSSIRAVVSRENIASDLLGKKFDHDFQYPVPMHEMFWRRNYDFPFPFKKPLTSITFSIGCPFSCSYCNTGNVHFAVRDPMNSAEELDWLAKKRITSLLIRDATFNNSPQTVLQTCSLISEKKMNIEWFCFARSDLLTESLVQSMAKAGCRYISMGIETVDPDLLKEHRRSVDFQVIRSSILWCRQNNIRVSGHFVLGLDGESRATLSATRRMILHWPFDFISINIFERRIGIPGLPPFPQEPAETENSKRQGLTESDLNAARVEMTRAFYFRFRYLIRRFVDGRTWRYLPHFLINGFHLMAGISKKRGVDKQPQ